MGDLLFCPWCGTAPDSTDPYTPVPGGWAVDCANLQCCAQGPARDTQGEAATAWNARDLKSKETHDG